MAKIAICDKCKRDLNKIVEAKYHTSVIHHPELKLDLCLDCIAERKVKYIRIDARYVVEVYRIKGMNISLEQAKTPLIAGGMR